MTLADLMYLSSLFNEFIKKKTGTNLHQDGFEFSVFGRSRLELFSTQMIPRTPAWFVVMVKYFRFINKQTI